MRYAIALVMALSLNAAANLMMKIGANRLNASGVSLRDGAAALGSNLLANRVLLLGLAFFAANVAFYTYALKGIRISTAYPIMVGAGFAIIALVAWRFLDERLSAAQWAGVSLVLLGVYLIAREMRPAA